MAHLFSICLWYQQVNCCLVKLFTLLPQAFYFTTSFTLNTDESLVELGPSAIISGRHWVTGWNIEIEGRESTKTQELETQIGKRPSNRILLPKRQIDENKGHKKQKRLSKCKTIYYVACSTFWKHTSFVHLVLHIGHGRVPVKLLVHVWCLDISEEIECAENRLKCPPTSCLTRIYCMYSSNPNYVHLHTPFCEAVHWKAWIQWAAVQSVHSTQHHISQIDAVLSPLDYRIKKIKFWNGHLLF